MGVCFFGLSNFWGPPTYDLPQTTKKQEEWYFENKVLRENLALFLKITQKAQGDQKIEQIEPYWIQGS